jgi:hypothetical protein
VRTGGAQLTCSRSPALTGGAFLDGRRAIPSAHGRRLDRDPAALRDARLAQGILKLLLRHFRAIFDTGGFGTLV